jgi:hypothetical protein
MVIVIGDVASYIAPPVGWLISFAGGVSSVIHDAVDYRIGLKSFEEAKNSMIATVTGMVPYLGDPVDAASIISDILELGKVPE